MLTDAETVVMPKLTEAAARLLRPDLFTQEVVKEAPAEERLDSAEESLLAIERAIRAAKEFLASLDAPDRYADDWVVLTDPDGGEHALTPNELLPDGAGEAVAAEAAGAAPPTVPTPAWSPVPPPPPAPVPVPPRPRRSRSTRRRAGPRGRDVPGSAGPREAGARNAGPRPPTSRPGAGPG